MMQQPQKTNLRSHQLSQSFTKSLSDGEVLAIYQYDLFTQAEVIHKTISLKIKTFFGQRDTHELQISPKTKISELLTELATKLGPSVFESLLSPRLYYPMGSIQFLTSSTKSVADYNITPGSILILMAQTTSSLPKWKDEDLLAGTKVRSSPH